MGATLLELDFRTGGNARPVLRGGWSFTETCGTWACGGQSALLLPGLPPGSCYRLELQLVPFLAAPTVPRQRLELLLNGAHLLSRELTTDQGVTTIVADMPAALLRSDSVNVLGLLHPDSARPSHHRADTGDGRDLAVRLLSLKLTAPSVRPPSRSVAIMTSVYNEAVNLPIWLHHYTRTAPQAALFVLDHGSDDGSTTQITPATRIPLPRHDYDDVRKAACVSDMQHALLRFYDVVIHVDCDELLVPDPQRYESLAVYLDELQHTCVNALGLNVLHVPGLEPPIDLSQPLLRQRRWCQFSASMCKPCITRVAVTWSAGFHDCNQPPRVDPALYLFHLKTLDATLARARQGLMRAVNWSVNNLEKGLGHHQRLSDDEFAKHFIDEPARRIAMGEVAAFDFSDDLARWQAETTSSGETVSTPHFRGRIAALPELMRDVF